MKGKFRIGDRVKITERGHGYGKVGIIKFIDMCGDYAIEVDD